MRVLRVKTIYNLAQVLACCNFEAFEQELRHECPLQLLSQSGPSEIR